MISYPKKRNFCVDYFLQVTVFKVFPWICFCECRMYFQYTYTSSCRNKLLLPSFTYLQKQQDNHGNHYCKISRPVSIHRATKIMFITFAIFSTSLSSTCNYCQHTGRIHNLLPQLLQRHLLVLHKKFNG